MLHTLGGLIDTHTALIRNVECGAIWSDGDVTLARM